MKKLQLFGALLIFWMGSAALAQNPFAEMANNPPVFDIIDQDVTGRVLVHASDAEITGSLGIGIDIPSPYSYGFDTFVLMENNLRIFFNDTSNSSSFPNNDWGITINDSSNGGDNYFGVSDRTAGRIPFKVEAGAPANALIVESTGDIGINTANPVLELHIVDGDTPSIRLEQDGTSGWPAQTWDMAGNETNFFIRDVTNSSGLPFRIRAGALTSAIDIGADGTVGINGSSSNANVSLDLTANNRGMLLNRMDNAGRTTLGGLLTAAEVGMVVYDTDDLATYSWDGTQWTAFGGGTDDQIVDTFQLNGDDLELSLEDDGAPVNTVDLSGYMDNTDNQDLDLTANTLSLTGDATTVDLSGYLDNTDDQDLDLTGNTLSLTGDATTVDLSGYLDNTDDQIADVFQLAGNDLELSLENDGAPTQTVDLSGYLDNTDNQDLDLAGNTLSLTGDATTVDLSGYLDNTDDQQISLDPNDILILEDGGSVDLGPFKLDTDDQILTDFSLSGTVLKVEIEDGNFLEVDIGAILAPLESRVTTLEQQMIDVLERLDIIEECACDGTLGGLPDFGVGVDQPRLFQNIPNPFDNTTSIGYFIPFTYTKANIVVSTTTGKILNNISITKFGEGSISVNKANMQAAMYFYTLYVDGKRVDTKRMIVE